jgi:hypothetical protein
MSPLEPVLRCAACCARTVSKPILIDRLGLLGGRKQLSQVADIMHFGME